MFQPYSEPWAVTARRTVIFAFVIGGLIAIVRHSPALLVRASAAAFVFTFGGHWVEMIWLNLIRNRIGEGRAAQMGGRLAYWAVGGLVLYAILAALFAQPLLLSWALAAPAFIVMELGAHSYRRVRGLPSFFDGQG